MLAVPLGSSSLLDMFRFRVSLTDSDLIGARNTFNIRPGLQGRLRNPSDTASFIEWNATGLGFYGAAPIAKPTVTGAKGGNAALTSLLAQLALLGLITDSTT